MPGHCLTRLIPIRVAAFLLAGVLFPSFGRAGEAAAGPSIEVVGVDVVPHRFSRELRWRTTPQAELGALVRLYVRHAGGSRDGAADALVAKPTFNGRSAESLRKDGEWAWHDTPEIRRGDERDRSFRPGHLDVWTFNGVRSAWAPGQTLKLEVERSGSLAGTDRQTIPVKLSVPEVRFARVLLQDTDADGLVDACTTHVINDSAEPVTLRALRVWSPGQDGRSLHDLAPGPEVTQFESRPVEGVIPAGERGVVRASLGQLPRARGVIEAQFRGPGDRVFSCWAHLRFKDDGFSIGSGWLDIPSKPGICPLQQEAFLKLIHRMHVDTTHVGELAGYTDATGPDGLYTRYPLKLMSGFEDVTRYRVSEWSRRIHGVDILGEPQMGKTPHESYEVLRRYDHATYPTTVTLSEEQGFRYFAGLSDYPHFDAYRVNAPASDRWSLYERWGEERIRWGAPLEGIGEMTRTLGDLSRPAPIAVWSQNAHEGWDSYAGRQRQSPTVDEIRIQAYEALANGVTALYWYSLQSWSTLKFRDTITETTRIGREIRLLQGMYEHADAYRHERRSAEGRPDWDLNSLVSPDAALLFAIDLAYESDRERREFRYRGSRELRADYELPAFLRSPVDVFRVDADGMHEVKHTVTERGVSIHDTVDRVGVYVAARKADLRHTLGLRHQELIQREAGYGADPGQDDEAFQTLLRALGYERVDEIRKTGWLRKLLDRSVQAAPASP